MERGKRKTTTTTRKTLNVATMADSVQHTRLKMGGPKSVRGTAAIEKRKSENSDSNSEDTTLINDSCSSDSADTNCSRDQRSLYQGTASSKMKVLSNSTSSTHSPSKQVLKKSRSEPMKSSSSSESELRKVRSDHCYAENSVSADHGRKNGAAAESYNVGVCDLDHHEQSNDQQAEDLMIDSHEDEEFADKVEQEVGDVVNACETEEVVAENSKEKVVLNNNTSGDHVDHPTRGEGESEGEHNKIIEDVINEDTCDDSCGGGCSDVDGNGDELIKLNKSEKNKILDDDVMDVNTSDGGRGGGDDDIGNQLNDGKKNKIVKDDDTDAKTRDDGGGGGGDDGGCGVGNGLIPLNTSKKQTKKVVSAHIKKFNSGLPKSTPSMSPTKSATPTSVSTPTPTATPTSIPTPTSTSSYKPITSRSNHKPSHKSHIPPTTERETSKQNDMFTTPENHGKLQTLVDLVMWRDISRSAFIFGIGTFVIISSSYAKDFEFSFISVASYMSLIYLAVMFLYKSFMCREMMDKEDCPEMYIWGEEEALWLVKLILPYLNELLVKLRGIFSGDPAMTMKLAVVLFVLARCGSSITLWKTVKLGFFGVFIVPKLCSSYSTHITAYGNFWIRRFRDAWESCSHKKALAFAIFTLVWNYSSVTARTWAAFMLVVAVRYYQQSLFTQDFAEEQQPAESYNAHLRDLARNRCRVPTSLLDQKKQKKSF